jgi:hypothetical protein
VSKPEHFHSASLSVKALKNIEKFAWPNGAVLSCSACLRRSEKTPEEMQRYMKKWPRCCGVPASVKPL